jgi:uncharacterized protein (DUF302 family)
MNSTPPTVPAGIVTKDSPHSLDATVSKLTELVMDRGMKIFAVIDQSAEARNAGLDLRPTTLVLFGNPAAGTPVMEAAPLAALDLPLKVLIWADEDGTYVSYVAPRTLADRYSLEDGLLANLAGIELLTDALVGP